MPTARHAAFHPLRVHEVERLTDDAVAVTFDVPPELRAAYRFRPGQHITVRRRTTVPGPHGSATGSEIRRTYSVCDPAPAAEGPRRLRIGVRLVEGGEFSTYALKELSAGDVLEVMTPAGRFTLDTAQARAGLAAAEVTEEATGTAAGRGDGGARRGGRYAAVVGGSGITPVLSIAATVLEGRPDTRFCLIRSDRTAGSAMFVDEVADLKDRYPARFQLVHVLSREVQQAGVDSGRLDEGRLTGLLPALLDTASVDAWFLCGPHGLVAGAERALHRLGVAPERVHQEIFHVADEGSATAPARERGGPVGTVRAVLDGRAGSWPAREGESVLETVLRNRADAPYACKGGVCGTCRARLLGGEVRMDRNFALEQTEIDAGYVLACQSHPVTEEVELDFDA
ncbi:MULTISPECIES: 2Fe-2S iron-sulfur cluster-binding protein [Streptomycetaceae]|uniref:Phenylacetic acid degradation NADH oxidoreductase n=1 Tax=Streptantibioticus cattleyicolor (strain ATCC 35852 / DSM 46488 / JCM 4925 / NBRC 14057 / NRRL 8057) TaxID=1003195 RepID=F8JSC0_STREN|nr:MULTISPECIES: 2Fe-2S iron-sulfur cluster-binding protein [Streptomycetaceae]AEW95434.1 phenylacetic acid degradation NADH oxidoreductase [Streptantibioticus cattleyicolor NRRL 8057 = DSM 46488]MYS60003.1 2Fe-2S iron-sulfur cluster binding domain-containing protein [Streptomyces sp. SID5468]CCB75777.1 Phenylacetic acid degradation NADH oxidoreductase [Streptantibioticus cattleyicolor NRRL 8057 = DSM 46488]